MQQVIYLSNTADEQFPTELRVRADGAGTLSVGSNRDDPAAPVGLFEGRVAPELTRPLFALLADDAFGDAAHQETLIPDETYRAISFDDAGDVLTRRVGEQIAASPGFIDAEALLLKVKAALREQPASAVALKLTALSAGPGGNVTAQLTIGNLSRHPARFDAPPRWGTEGATSGDLVVLRSDIDPAQLGSQHQFFVPLADATVQQFSPAAAGAYVDVAAGAALTVTLTLPRGWPPGRYDARLDLVVLLYSADGGSLLQLNLVSAAQTLAV